MDKDDGQTPPQRPLKRSGSLLEKPEAKSTDVTEDEPTTTASSFSAFGEPRNAAHAQLREESLLMRKQSIRTVSSKTLSRLDAVPNLEQAQGSRVAVPTSRPTPTLQPADTGTSATVTSGQTTAQAKTSTADDTQSLFLPEGQEASTESPYPSGGLCCRHWLFGNQCRYGRRCKFAHERRKWLSDCMPRQLTHIEEQKNRPYWPIPGPPNAEQDPLRSMIPAETYDLRLGIDVPKERDLFLDVKANFTRFPLNVQAKLKSQYNSGKTMWFVEMCDVGKVKAMLDAQFTANVGRVVPLTRVEDAFHKLVDVLTTKGRAIVARSDQFVVVLTPLKEEWDILQSKSKEEFPVSLIGYLLVPAPRIQPGEHWRNERTQERELLFALKYGINEVKPEEVFGRPARRDKNAVWLMLPSHNKESLALAGALFEPSMRAYLNEAGRWEGFLKDGWERAIVLPNSFDAFHTIKDFKRIVHSERPLRVYRFNISATPRTALPRVNLEPLFIRGRAVLIMDECYELCPIHAWEIVELTTQIMEAELTKQKPLEQKALHPICSRPDLVEFLDDLMRKSVNERTPEKRVARFRLWDTLRRISLRESVHGHVKSQLEQDRSEDVRSVYAPAPHRIPEWRRAEREGDKVRASKILANWFSGWANFHAHMFRNFIIVTEADEVLRKEWTKQWPHLFIFNTPEYLAQMKKQYGSSSG